MFTGIIAELGLVRGMKKTSGGSAVLTLSGPVVSKDAALGDSIAVNGACLTVTNINGGELSFDVSAETLRATTLGELAPGGKVNLEPALRVGGKLGGHFVTGHVDAAGKIRSRGNEGPMLRFDISAPKDIVEQLVPKGSIAVDGISLTVVDVLDDGFTLVIIPHTASLTTLGFKGAGQGVNLETDMLGKYVRKLLGLGSVNSGKEPDGGDALMKALLKQGYAS